MLDVCSLAFIIEGSGRLGCHIPQHRPAVFLLKPVLSMFYLSLNTSSGKSMENK